MPPTRLTETDAPATHVTHDAARAHGSPVARHFRVRADTVRDLHGAPRLPKVGDALAVPGLDGLRCHAVIPVRIAGRAGEWDVVALYKVTGPLGRAGKAVAA